MRIADRIDFSKLVRRLSPSRYVRSDVQRYAYLNARIGAMRSHLLRTEDMMALEGARTLRDYVTVLEHTQYNKALSEIKDHEVLTVDKALVNSIVDLNKRMISLAPGKVRPFFEARSRKYETENTKTIINAIGGGIPAEQIRQQLFPVSDKLTSRLLNAQTVEEAAETALGEDNAEKLGKSLQIYKDIGDLKPLLAVMDVRYYKRVWDSAEKLSNKDGRIAKKLIGMEIDTLNIMTLLRGKWKGYDVRDFIIPVGQHINPIECLEECAELETISDTVNVFSETIYETTLSRGLTYFEDKKTLIQFETGLKKQIIEENRKTLRESRFNIGTPLSFLRIKEAEIENLRALAAGISEELPKEEIAQLIA